MKTELRQLYTIIALLLLLCFMQISVFGQSSRPDKSKGQKNKTILETARQNRDLSTFVSAIKATDLEETLTGSESFTIFAPSNAAFDSLPDGALKDLLKPENKAKLKEILLNHVVRGKYLSKNLGNGENLQTVADQDLGISALGGKVMAGGVEVIKPDIMASNGVIHIVNRVIVPPTEGADANK